MRTQVLRFPTFLSSFVGWGPLLYELAPLFSTGFISYVTSAPRRRALVYACLARAQVRAAVMRPDKPLYTGIACT